MKAIISFLTTALALIAATPAERKIESAKNTIASDPKRPEGYNALAMALAARARESADPIYYQQAMEQVEKSISLTPDNFEATKAKIWILLGTHRFDEARVIAEKLNKQVPD